MSGGLANRSRLLEVSGGPGWTGCLFPGMLVACGLDSGGAMGEGPAQGTDQNPRDPDSVPGETLGRHGFKWTIQRFLVKRGGLAPAQNPAEAPLVQRVDEVISKTARVAKKGRVNPQVRLVLS